MQAERAVAPELHRLRHDAPAGPAFGPGDVTAVEAGRLTRNRCFQRGAVSPVSDAEADAYFATRARPAQLGAWASDQSRTLTDRLALEKRIAEAGLKFGLGKVPRPPHWSGFRVEPEAIEFWRDRPFRLHERLVFQREAGGWTTHRLFP